MSDPTAIIRDNRQNYMVILRLSLGLVFGLSVFPVSAGEVPEGQPRNVIIIVADDVGIGDVSCYGSETVKTPNIDRLAKEGLRFRQGYTTCSVCNPTRYSILTGRFPCRSVFRDPKFASNYHQGKFPLTIDPELPIFPRFMKQQGFRTAAIGKWHLGYGETEADYERVMTPGPVDIGFDVHFGVPGNHNDRFERYVVGDSIYRHLSVEPGPARVDDSSREVDPVERIDDLVDTTLTQQACDFIDGSADQRFFLYLTYCATHTHITPRADFRGRSKIGQLGDYMMELDHHVGEIISRLQQHSIADQTLVIFTSDNGGQENDVKGAGKSLTLADESGDVATLAQNAKRVARTEYGHKTNGSLRGYKARIYEGGFRVPLIAHWPERIEAGSETDAVFSLVDLFATVANLVAEHPKSCGMDSIDQSQVLLNPESISPRKTLVLNAPHGQLAIRQGDWKLLTTKPVTWEGERPQLERVPIALYNLADDPAEVKNLASAKPKKVEQLQSLLIDAIASGAKTQSR